MFGRQIDQRARAARCTRCKVGLNELRETSEILFAGVGAWIGATLGERWVGKPMKESVKIGGAAFLGRLFGTAGKLLVGSTMVVLAIAAPFVPLLTN